LEGPDPPAQRHRGAATVTVQYGTAGITRRIYAAFAERNRQKLHQFASSVVKRYRPVHTRVGSAGNKTIAILARRWHQQCGSATSLMPNGGYLLTSFLDATTSGVAMGREKSRAVPSSRQKNANTALSPGKKITSNHNSQLFALYGLLCTYR